MLNAGGISEHLFIKVTVYLPFSFSKKLSRKQDIAFTEISYQFLASKIPVMRRNKLSHQLQYFNRSNFSCNENPCIR